MKNNLLNTLQQWGRRFFGFESNGQKQGALAPPTALVLPIPANHARTNGHPVVEKRLPLSIPASQTETAASDLPSYKPFPELFSSFDSSCEHTLVVYCLGAFRVLQNGQLITEWQGSKGLAVLKYLIAQRGKPVSKDMLMEAIWPESDAEAAKRNLHQAVYSLRQTLKSKKPNFQHVEFHHDHYQLAPAYQVWIDFVLFEKLVHEGQQLVLAGRIKEALQTYSQAEALYQGDFLQDTLYEEWTIPQREQLRLHYFDVATRLIGEYVRQQAYTAAITLGQKVLARDSCQEVAHRCLMIAYSAQGQRHLAVRQYLACVQALRNELDLLPSAETVAVYQQITA